MTDNKKKTHLIITGRGGGDQVQADWNQSDSEQPDYIKNKPSLATVATSGDYDDLTNKPTIPAAPVQSDWNEADSSSLAYINNKPTIPAAQVNADWDAVSGVAEILNKPTIPPQQWFGTQAEYDLIDPKTLMLSTISRVQTMYRQTGTRVIQQPTTTSRTNLPYQQTLFRVIGMKVTIQVWHIYRTSRQ